MTKQTPKVYTYPHQDQAIVTPYNEQVSFVELTWKRFGAKSRTTEYFFVSNKDLKGTGHNLDKLLKLPSYDVITDDALAALQTRPLFHVTDGLQLVNDHADSYRPDPYNRVPTIQLCLTDPELKEQVAAKTVKIENLRRRNEYDLYKVDAIYPDNLPLLADYTSLFTERYFDLDKVKTFLETSSEVLSYGLKKASYFSDGSIPAGYDVVLKLSDSLWLELCDEADKYYEKYKSEYTLDIKCSPRTDALRYGSQDYLGLKALERTDEYDEDPHGYYDY